MMFKLGESIASATFDDQMLDLLSRLAEVHVDPSISDPAKLAPDYVYVREKRNKDDEDDEDDGEVAADGEQADPHRWRDSVALGDNGYEPERMTAAEMDVDGASGSGWRGISRDVGIFTEEEFKGIMTICLTSMSECFPARLFPRLAYRADLDALGDGDDEPEGAKHASGQTSDAKLSSTMERMSKPTDRIRTSFLSLDHLRLCRLI